jgi:hypothetical protein
MLANSCVTVFQPTHYFRLVKPTVCESRVVLLADGAARQSRDPQRKEWK